MTLHSLPSFSSIDPNLFAEQLQKLLQLHLERIDAILQSHTVFTWANLMQPLDEMDNELEQFWSPFSHLHAVVNSKSLRDCYQACLPQLSAYETAIGQNHLLYMAIQSLDQTLLNETQRKIIDDSLRNFVLSGVALSPEHKQRFEVISTRLSELSNQFENNILDAVLAYQYHVTDEERMQGLPIHAMENARILAQEKNLPGWLFTLEYPSYLAVITYADDRALRETLYEAFVTRASDQGPLAGQFDNTSVMNEILALRHEMAKLLGFDNYAMLSLVTKMAKSTTLVNQFLLDLSQRAHAQAVTEINDLRTYAKQEYQLNEIKPWDIAYLSEKKKQAHYTISQEELRAFFPLNRVMKGLLSILRILYGISFEAINNVDVWHPDVICYQIHDEKNNTRGYIYMDLFARPHKRGGAWMDSTQSRLRLANGDIQLPIATLTCNFAKTTQDKSPTLSHEEVETLFHEFGHCLQHVLTTVDYIGASGIHGVEWDAVELPSQFFENWCWDQDALQLLTAHVETGEALSAALFERLRAAKNFQSALGMMRQLEFSLFDFRMHQEYDSSNPSFIADILADVRKDTLVVPITAYNRFQHSFSHIFAGGYAAGYYSYKWAEVLSSDAFSRFEEEGVLNPKTGRDFLHAILETGGSKKALQAYIQFRGREATIDALLRHNGIQGLNHV